MGFSVAEQQAEYLSCSEDLDFEEAPRQSNQIQYSLKALRQYDKIDRKTPGIVYSEINAFKLDLVSCQMSKSMETKKGWETISWGL